MISNFGCDQECSKFFILPERLIIEPKEKKTNLNIDY